MEKQLTRICVIRLHTLQPTKPVKSATLSSMCYLSNTPPMQHVYLFKIQLCIEQRKGIFYGTCDVWCLVWCLVYPLVYIQKAALHCCIELLPLLRPATTSLKLFTSILCSRAGEVTFGGLFVSKTY